MISKPRCFLDLLELQKILDDEVSKPRENGFEPRKRNEQDILSALDDEFQEWQKELPYEYNFKTWKQKEYNREKELEEFVDVLFFFLQYVNYRAKIASWVIEDFEEAFYDYIGPETEISLEIPHLIYCFKGDLWCNNIEDAFYEWRAIAYVRGFTTEEIFDTYWKKWQFNMGRQNKDWVIQE